jgi:phosphatidylethanolamine/phosphatidyl-N-methylethanolamine N-methyltransferase
MLQPRRLFREQARSDFRNVGAIAPSSRWLARALAGGLVAGGPTATESRWLLEVGPGTGVVTAALAAAMGPADTLLVVEQNAAFAAYLEQRIADDAPFHAVRNRIHVRHTCVESLDPEPTFHRIVSSLPFNNFTPDEVERFLELFRRLLLPGGELRFYEYLGIRRLRSLAAAPAERRRLAGVHRVLSAALTACPSRSRLVWWNLPPAVVHSLLP